MNRQQFSFRFYLKQIMSAISHHFKWPCRSNIHQTHHMKWIQCAAFKEPAWNVKHLRLSLTHSIIWCKLLSESSFYALNMSEKTPVSILQELCVKYKDGAPIYEEIPDESDDGKIFACIVQAFGATAKGAGRSKREAKHTASAKLISWVNIHFLIFKNFLSFYSNQLNYRLFQTVPFAESNLPKPSKPAIYASQVALPFNGLFVNAIVFKLIYIIDLHYLDFLKMQDRFKNDLPSEVPHAPRTTSETDAVGTLLDICVQRNFPLPT